MTHWAEQYIGEEWVAHRHDCWGFFRRIQQERFGIHVPEIDIDSHAPLLCRHTFKDHMERKKWEKVETPREGDAVLMGKNPRPSHVGTLIESPTPSVLHCVEHIGVVVQSLSSLKAMGWRVIGFYRHVSHE
jgi:cell wall-associated NlpC family hydrolase